MYTVYTTSSIAIFMQSSSSTIWNPTDKMQLVDFLIYIILVVVLLGVFFERYFFSSFFPLSVEYKKRAPVNYIIYVFIGYSSYILHIYILHHFIIHIVFYAALKLLLSA